MSEAKCCKCGQTGQALFLRFGKQLCYPCLDEASTGIPYVRDLEAEVARITKRCEELEAAIRAHRAAYLAAGTVKEECAAEFDKQLWKEVTWDDKTDGELQARREIMAWAVDKLEKWERLLPEPDRATCCEIRHALSPDNPKLRAAGKGVEG